MLWLVSSNDPKKTIDGWERSKVLGDSIGLRTNSRDIWDCALAMLNSAIAAQQPPFDLYSSLVHEHLLLGQTTSAHVLLMTFKVIIKS